MRMRAATRQLQTSETFKRFDDGFTPTYMVALRGACLRMRICVYPWACGLLLVWRVID